MRLIPVMFTGVCMAHRTTCLIPTCKNTCARNNTKTTFLEIFFIGYHFITARKVSSAISSLDVCKKTFEKSCNIDRSRYHYRNDRSLTRESRTLPRLYSKASRSFNKLQPTDQIKEFSSRSRSPGNIFPK